MSTNQSLAINAYHVGIICALPHELTAVRAMLDEEHAQPQEQDSKDHNTYALGQMGQHNIVIACLPAGRYGTNAAATVARDMLRTFTDLRISLMVGIGGGIPTLGSGRNIRLGDVVISQPTGTFGGVVQYDMGKALGRGIFDRKNALNSPPTLLLTALGRLRSDRDLKREQAPQYLEEAYQKHPSLQEEGYMSPGEDHDRLHCANCQSSHWWWILWLLVIWLCPPLACQECDRGEVRRRRRDHHHMQVHYGTIASGNQVIKDSSKRDQLGRQLGALCVEMEAAGLMNDFPCIVIRGICDYADSHKSDAWQNYAAITAAACAKDLLRHVNPIQTREQQRIQDVVGILTDQLHVNREILAETQRQISTTQLRYQDDRHRRCHQAFKTCSYESFKDLNRPKAEGTCQWVLNHHQFVDWPSSTRDGLLWISADPGCGKSVLAKSLADRELRGSATHSSCYFFFKDNEDQDHLSTALCAILHQLFAQQPWLIRHALDMWDKNGDKMQQEVLELWRTLLAAARDRDAHDITCILDALDECRPSDQSRLIGMLASFHADGQRIYSAEPGARLKFVVTSRPYDNIEHGFDQKLRNLPTIRLRGEEENDQIREEINAVVRERVAGLAQELQLQERARALLEKKLLGMEHRTYLWLHLALESFTTTMQNSLRPEDETLEMLPSTVDDAYEKILSRVKDQQDVVRKTLQIVVGTRRPLTVAEMAIALGIATKQTATTQKLDDVRLNAGWMKRNLREWCGLFLFINHDRIYLIHQTAKEFLLTDSRTSAATAGWKHCLDISKTEEEMSRLYVNFLSLEDVCATTRDLSRQLITYRVKDLTMDDPVQSLIAYAAEYWPSHLRAGSFVPDAIMADQLSQLYNTTSTLQHPWFTIYWRITRPYHVTIPRITALHLAAMLGHEYALAQFMEPGSKLRVNDRDNTDRTALVWACERGHTRVVQMLLGKEAEVNAQGGDYGTALRAASSQGHGSIVRILLDAGAEVNTQCGDYGNALQAASSQGHSSIVRILLDAGAEVHAQGGHYGNALQAASSQGHGSIVRILLDAGAEVNAQGGFYGNALQAASSRGHGSIVRILLDAGAEVNAQGGPYSNALSAALYSGYDSIVRMLLDTGADGQTALLRAALKGHEKIIKMLIETQGINVNSKDDYGFTPLLWAVLRGHVRGHEKIIKMLKETQGIDVNSKDNYGRTPLSWASLRGYEKVVKMLMETQGVDVNSKDNSGRTPLSWASSRGHEKVVKMLMEMQGVDVDSKDDSGRTPLFHAARNGNHEVAKTLVTAYRAALDCKDYYGSTALSTATRNGHSEVVKVLLPSSHLCPTYKDSFGQTLTWWASRSGNAGVMHLLLQHARMADVHFGEEHLVQYGPVTFNSNGRWCDACTLTILPGSAYYHCEICNNGDFDVCAECSENGILCRDDSHTLIRV